MIRPLQSQVRRKKNGNSTLELHFPLSGSRTQPLAFLDRNFLHFHDPLAAHLFHLGYQRATLVESGHVVAASYRFAVDQDVGDCSTACGLLERSLQAWAERVEVEFYDVWRGCYCVGGKEDVLGRS
jgi:hypothetical protein